MNLNLKSIAWFNPAFHSVVALSISLLTAYLAFRNVDLDEKTRNTFMAYYLILGLMTLLFSMRTKLTDPKTRQLLQLSFSLFGLMLMITGVLGMFNTKIAPASVFILILFLPGLAILRAGLHFNHTGE